VESPGSEEDAPKDELAFHRTQSMVRNACGATVCGAGESVGGETPMKSKVPVEVMEDEDEDDGGILGAFVDLCTDCGNYLGADAAPPTAAEPRRKSRRSSLSKSQQQREEEEDAELDAFLDAEEYEEEDVSSQEGSVDLPTHTPRKKSSRRSSSRARRNQPPPQRALDDDEYTEIEVEYAGDGAHDTEDDGLTPLKGNGDGTASTVRSPTENFVQLDPLGDVTTVRPPGQRKPSAPTASMADPNGDVPPTNNNLNTSSSSSHSHKSWSANEKNNYLRAMAQNAKADFRRTKGLEDESLRDAVAKGSALAQTHDADRALPKEKEAVNGGVDEDTSSLDGILDETNDQLPPVASGGVNGRSKENWAPAEKRRFVQLVNSEDQRMGPEEATRLILASRRASPRKDLEGGEYDGGGGVIKDLSQIRSKEFDSIVSSMGRSTSRSYPFQPIDEGGDETTAMTNRKGGGRDRGRDEPTVSSSTGLEPSVQSKDIQTNKNINTHDPREIQSDIGYHSQGSNTKSTSFLNGGSILANMRKKPGFTRVVEGRGLDNDTLGEDDRARSNPGTARGVAIDDAMNFVDGGEGIKRKKRSKKGRSAARGLGVGGDDLGDDFDQEGTVDRARSNPGSARAVTIDDAESFVDGGSIMGGDGSKKRSKKGSKWHQMVDNSMEEEADGRGGGEENEDTFNQVTSPLTPDKKFPFDDRDTNAKDLHDDLLNDDNDITYPHQSQLQLHPLNSVSLNAYRDSDQVSMLGQSTMGGYGGGGSVAMSTLSRGTNAESIYTTATNASAWSISTRQRHRGAARSRVVEGQDGVSGVDKRKNVGWLSSMKAAAEATNKEWNMKEGFVGYKEPEVKYVGTNMERIGRLKAPKSSRSLRKGMDGDDDEDRMTAQANIALPPSWEKDREKMVSTRGGFMDDDGDASAVTEVVSNTQAEVVNNKRLEKKMTILSRITDMSVDSEDQNYLDDSDLRAPSLPDFADNLRTPYALQGVSISPSPDDDLRKPYALRGVSISPTTEEKDISKRAERMNDDDYSSNMLARQSRNNQPSDFRTPYTNQITDDDDDDNDTLSTISARVFTKSKRDSRKRREIRNVSPESEEEGTISRTDYINDDDDDDAPSPIPARAFTKSKRDSQKRLETRNVSPEAEEEDVSRSDSLKQRVVFPLIVDDGGTSRPGDKTNHEDNPSRLSTRKPRANQAELRKKYGLRGASPQADDESISKRTEKIKHGDNSSNLSPRHSRNNTFGDSQEQFGSRGTSLKVDEESVSRHLENVNHKDNSSNQLTGQSKSIKPDDSRNKYNSVSPHTDEEAVSKIADMCIHEDKSSTLLIRKSRDAQSELRKLRDLSPQTADEDAVSKIADTLIVEDKSSNMPTRHSREDKFKADEKISYTNHSGPAQPQGQQQTTPTTENSSDDNNDELNQSELYDWIEGGEDSSGNTDAMPSVEREPSVVENGKDPLLQDTIIQIIEDTNQKIDEVPKHIGVNTAGFQNSDPIPVSIEQADGQSDHRNGNLDKSVSQESLGQFVDEFNHVDSSFDCSAEEPGILTQTSESSMDYGFKVIKDPTNVPGFYTPASITNLKASMKAGAVPNLLDLSDEQKSVMSLNRASVPAKAKANAKAKAKAKADSIINIDDTDNNSTFDTAQSHLSHNTGITSSSNNSTTRAKEWLKRVESRKKDISDKGRNRSGKGCLSSPIFVSAADENSTIDLQGYGITEDSSVFEKLDNDTVFDCIDEVNEFRNPEEKPFGLSSRGTGCFDTSAAMSDWKSRISPSKIKPVPYAGIGGIGGICTLDLDNQTAASDITDHHASDSPGDGQFNVQSVLSRLRSCSAPQCTEPAYIPQCSAPVYTAPSMNGHEDSDDTGELPLAHLAFLRKSQDSGPPPGDYHHKKKQENMFDMLSTPSFCGRPEAIYEEDEEDEEEDDSKIIGESILDDTKIKDHLHVQEATCGRSSVVSAASVGSVASAYLDTIRTKYGSSKTPDIISPTAQAYGINRDRSLRSNTSAEVFAKKKVDDILSRLHDNVVDRNAQLSSTNVVKAAEELAATRMQAKQLSSTNGVKAAEELAATRMQAKTYREPVQAMRKSDDAKAAGGIVASRVKSMMFMSNKRFEEGEI